MQIPFQWYIDFVPRLSEVTEVVPWLLLINTAGVKSVVFDGFCLWSGTRIPNDIQVTRCLGANVYVSGTTTICSSLVSVVFKWVKNILLKCVSLFKSKGQQWRAPEEGQREAAPTNDTLRSSVSSHLWSDATLCPWKPFILELGGLLNKMTFVMRKVTSCAAHCAGFKCSLQNMASGESFERGQLFTIKIWPLKTQIVFFLSCFALSNAHNPKREAADWKYKTAHFFVVFIQISPRGWNVQKLICKPLSTKCDKIERQTFPSAALLLLPT